MDLLDPKLPTREEMLRSLVADRAQIIAKAKSANPKARKQLDKLAARLDRLAAKFGGWPDA